MRHRGEHRTELSLRRAVEGDVAALALLRRPLDHGRNRHDAAPAGPHGQRVRGLAGEQQDQVRLVAQEDRDEAGNTRRAFALPVTQQMKEVDVAEAGPLEERLFTGKPTDHDPFSLGSPALPGKRRGSLENWSRTAP